MGEPRFRGKVRLSLPPCPSSSHTVYDDGFAWRRKDAIFEGSTTETSNSGGRRAPPMKHEELRNAMEEACLVRPLTWNSDAPHPARILCTFFSVMPPPGTMMILSPALSTRAFKQSSPSKQLDSCPDVNIRSNPNSIISIVCVCFVWGGGGGNLQKLEGDLRPFRRLGEMWLSAAAPTAEECGSSLRQSCHRAIIFQIPLLARLTLYKSQYPPALPVKMV